MEVHAFAIYSLFMIATHAYLWTWLWTLILASPHVFCESLMNFVKPFQLFFIQKWPNLKSKSGSNLQILNRPACLTRLKIHYKKKVVTVDSSVKTAEVFRNTKIWDNKYLMVVMIYCSIHHKEEQGRTLTSVWPPKS